MYGWKFICSQAENVVEEMCKIVTQLNKLKKMQVGRLNGIYSVLVNVVHYDHCVTHERILCDRRVSSFGVTVNSSQAPRALV